MPFITADDTVLFQGDSITRTGRDAAQLEPNVAGGLGNGYVFHAAAALLTDHPGGRLTIYNRGIGGNRVLELADRWHSDCLDLKPTVLSILIGVNDTWHGKGGDPTRTVPLDVYEQTYRQLIADARAASPGLKLVLCEPFALRCGAVNDGWFPEIDQRRAIVQRIAADEGAAFVAFQAAFDAALNHAPPDYWAADGVHPTIPGHLLMARTWLEAVA